MFGSFDEMFDYDRDGKLDAWEQAMEYQFMEDMLKEGQGGFEEESDDYDDYDSNDNWGFDD